MKGKTKARKLRGRGCGNTAASTGEPCDRPGCPGNHPTLPDLDDNRFDMSAISNAVMCPHIPEAERQAWLPIPPMPTKHIDITAEEIDIFDALMERVYQYPAEECLPEDRHFSPAQIINIIEGIDEEERDRADLYCGDLREKLETALEELRPYAINPTTDWDKQCRSCHGFGVSVMTPYGFQLHKISIACHTCRGTGQRPDSTMNGLDENRYQKYFTPEQSAEHNASGFVTLILSGATPLGQQLERHSLIALEFYDGLHSRWPKIGADKVLNHHIALSGHLQMGTQTAQEVLASCTALRADRATMTAAQRYLKDCQGREEAAKLLLVNNCTAGLARHLHELGACTQDTVVGTQDSYDSHDVAKRLGTPELDFAKLPKEAARFSEFAGLVSVEAYFHRIPPADYTAL